MQKNEEQYQRSLCEIAKLYAGLGYSVLPVYGDRQLDKAKVSAVSWKPYQLRRASDEQITQWFLHDGYGGIGIVTGRISNLVVIDFDDPPLQHEFEIQFPDLLKTRVVISANRGLAHYYYALPTTISIPTLHINGADLLSNGCYVLAPPTVIDGNAYKIQQGGMPYRLNEGEVKRLQKFFNVKCEPKQNSFVPIPSRWSKEIGVGALPCLRPTPEPDTVTTGATPINSPRKAISPSSLVHLYQHYAPQIGRNNALFKVACHARDHHMNMEQVVETLQHIHAQQMTYQIHVPENAKQRLQEANLTIKSAFRVPPRSLRDSDVIQLTNSIREALLKRKLTCVARVLDGLFLNGFKPGDVITKKMVLNILEGDIGKHSILAAFTAEIDATSIFTRASVPPQPPSDTLVAKGKAKTTQTKCYLFTPSKPEKNPRGRIPTQFYVPDPNVLCNLLGVPFTRSDPLTIEDIQQAKTYRQAVHREFIKRRPGMYHRYWLARRIGVSQRTSQRYDEGAGVKRKPMFIYETITWQDLGKIPSDEPIAGMFLEDEKGKRYPGLRVIAARLLARKHKVRYAYQDVNYYWYGEHPPLVQIQYGINPRQATVDAKRQKMEQFVQTYWKDFRAKKHVKSIAAQSARKGQVAKGAITATQSYAIQPYGDNPLPTMTEERITYLAGCLYKAVWEKAVNEKSRLSKVNARQLVEKYGDQLIRRVLGVLKYRQNINNPAGFIVVWLRSTAKDEQIVMRNAVS